MPKLRRDVQPLLERSIDSLTWGIELFNRPTDTARWHAVPMLLHHAFERVLKAAILQRQGRPGGHPLRAGARDDRGGFRALANDKPRRLRC